MYLFGVMQVSGVDNLPYGLGPGMGWGMIRVSSKGGVGGYIPQNPGLIYFCWLGVKGSGESGH